MELYMRIGGTILRFLFWLVGPLFKIYEYYHKKQIPEPKDPLLFISATELAKKIRNKELKSYEIVNAYVKRITEVNRFVNAVVQDRFIAALEDAENVDNYIKTTKLTENELKTQKPLLGVPVTIKESCQLKDLEFSVGNVARINLKAKENGEAVTLLLEAGAIPLLVSNTPEYCLSWDTSNYVTGTANNPYNLSRTTGGSSGGEGALMGSGASVIGIGSDLAGSIRLPALFNGVFGHKPTAGIVSINGHFPMVNDKQFINYLTLGPLCRYAEDLSTMLKVLSGNKAQELGLDETVDLRKLRIFYMYSAGKSSMFTPVQDEIKTSIKRSVLYLNKKYNCKLVNKTFNMEDTCEIGTITLYGMKNIPNVLVNPENPKENLNILLEMLKSLVGFSSHSFIISFFYALRYLTSIFSKNKLKHYENEAANLKNAFLTELGKDGVFLYPTFPTAAFIHGQIPFLAMGAMYTMIFNVLGFPSTHVPLGLNKDGLPIGLQVVAAPYQDKLCIAVAKELEKEFGGWVPPGSNKLK